jgi:hypothetical protein
MDGAMPSLLDHPAVTENLFYPRPSFAPPPPGARDLLVPVAPGVRLHARLHAAASALAHVVLFHGNGEVVSDYDDAAASFARAGAALAVIEYRGYGRSEGQPTLRSLLADARPAYEGVRAALAPSLPVVLMGRSLGSACAAELAATLEEPPAGVILESGFSDVGGFAARRGLSPALVTAADVDTLGPLRKLAGSAAPLLVLHGELDALIPATEARAAHAASGAADKRLVVVPGRGHNDLSFHPAYWEALADFVRRVTGTR